MTKQEELRRRAAILERRAERRQEEPRADALRSAFYAALFGSASSREENVRATF